MTFAIFSSRKLNPIQRFWMYLKWKSRFAMRVPAFLHDTHWSGNLQALFRFIGMTIDVKRQRVIQSLNTGIYIRDLQTGELLQHLDPEWSGWMAYHKEDVLVVSNSETTWLVSPETFEVLQAHPWGGQVSRDGTQVLVTHPEPMLRDALSGQVLQNLTPDPLPWARSEDGRYGLRFIAAPGQQGFLHQIIDLSRLEAMMTLPRRQSPEHREKYIPEENAPLVLSHDPENHRLAVGYRNQQVQVLDTLTWQTQQVLDLYFDTHDMVGLCLSGEVLHYVTQSLVGTCHLSGGQHQQVECMTQGFDLALFHEGTWTLGTHGLTTTIQDGKVLWQAQEHHGPEEPCTVHLTMTGRSTFTARVIWREQNFTVSGQVEALRAPLDQHTRSDIHWHGPLVGAEGQEAGRVSFRTRGGKHLKLGEVLDGDIRRGLRGMDGRLMPIKKS